MDPSQFPENQAADWTLMQLLRLLFVQGQVIDDLRRRVGQLEDGQSLKKPTNPRNQEQDR